MSIEERMKILEQRLVAIENVMFHRTEETAAEKEGKLLADFTQEIAAKLEVYDVDGETRVKAKEWLDWETFTLISNGLRKQGFERHSAGKDSYWHRRD